MEAEVEGEYRKNVYEFPIVNISPGLFTMLHKMYLIPEWFICYVRNGKKLWEILENFSI